ncbi:hypothetical protein [Curtobacterium sp. MCPF17_003]|uniref:hypothetical protein n=1 Tax=Curtobacterium sp. MCPF17_003 TaxID=2175637 RepID=UPI0011B5CD3F|nr:hypothetical protein [Curtobacterium sp. MCPF17_003]
MNPWTVVGPLAGALIVALIGAASIQVANWIQHNRERRAKLLEVRREQYFAAIEAADNLRVAVRQYGGHNSGRIDPATAATPEEAAEMVERDELAAAAVDSLADEYRNLNRLATLVEAVGSFGVSQAIREMIERVEAYMEAEANASLFVARDHMSFRAQYDDLFDAFTLAVRADLEIDKLFVAKRNGRDVDESTAPK